MVAAGDLPGHHIGLAEVISNEEERFLRRDSDGVRVEDHTPSGP